MLAETLKKELSDPELVANYFAGSKEKLIRRITYFNDNGYGSGVNVYFMSKKSFQSPADALCAGWLRQFLWEEEGEDAFDYSPRVCRSVVEEFFSEDIKRYQYLPADEIEVKNYLASRIQPIVQTTAKAQAACKRPEKVAFLSRSGIYVDKIYTAQKSYLFKREEKFVEGLILFEDKKGNGYREIFFETDSKFALFLE